MIISDITYWIAIIILHGIIGIGPGVIFGFLLANATSGRQFEHHDAKFSRAIKEATEHNAQWHPDHERWQR